VLAAKIDGLEGAEGGLITGSGMAAVTAVLLGPARAGDHVVGGDQLYGRSLRMLAEDLPRFGIATSLADPTDAAAVAAALRPETRMILIEVVSNPTLRVADMDGIAWRSPAPAACILLVVDNTFTTPRGWRPFEHGADIVIHSVTKLLAGHSDATLGYAAARDAGTAQRSALRRHHLRPDAQPVRLLAGRARPAFLCPALRPGRGECRALADHLATLPGVRRVLYPTAPRSPRPQPRRGLLGRAAATCSASRSRAAARPPTR
jgi:cystathionine gamma-synthase